MRIHQSIIFLLLICLNAIGANITNLYTSQSIYVGQSLTLIPSSNNPLFVGQVGYWAFDGNADDSSGNGNNGTGTNSPNYVAGHFGSALAVVGSSSQSVGIGGKPLILAVTNGTFSCWLKVIGPGSSKVFMSNGDLGNDKNGITFFESEVVGLFGLSTELANNSTSQILSGTADMITNVFYNVVVIWDSSNLTIFTNGIAYRTIAQTTVPNPNVFNLTFGADGTGSLFSTCLIDDARVWNRALSGSEVLDLFNYTP